jgi:hypothetical protein
MFRPRIVVVEAITPDTLSAAWASWEPILVEHGYQFVYFDAVNRFYVRHEDEGLREHFRLPPNVLDGFETHEVVRLRSLQVPPVSAGFPAGRRASVWVRTETAGHVEWRHVSELSLVPYGVLRLLGRGLSGARRWARRFRRRLRWGPRP